MILVVSEIPTIPVISATPAILIIPAISSAQAVLLIVIMPLIDMI